MARSTNILLACVAMLGAMLLAMAMTPHNLMARTHDVFNIDKHLPTQFGDWKPVEGLNVVAPPAPNSLEASLYNQEASRGFVDPDGHVVMLMVALARARATACSCIIRRCATRRRVSGCRARPRSSSTIPPRRRRSK